MGFYIDKVYDNGRSDDYVVELTFLPRKGDEKVAFAILANAPDEKCYYWEAEGYHLDLREGYHNSLDNYLSYNDDDKKLSVSTALECEKVSSITELLIKGNIDYDDVKDFSKYEFVGIDKPRKITNAEILEAINRLTDITLKLVDKLVEK